MLTLMLKLIKKRDKKRIEILKDKRQLLKQMAGTAEETTTEDYIERFVIAWSIENIASDCGENISKKPVTSK